MGHRKEPSHNELKLWRVVFGQINSELGSVLGFSPPSGTGFKDRRTGRAVFGILEILLVGICLVHVRPV